MNIQLSPFLQKIQVKTISDEKRIYDPIRKRWLIFTPEEMVRQTIILYLRDQKGYPFSLMSVERATKVNTMKKRYDLVVFKKNGEALMLVECKSPYVKLTQSAINQISMYNQKVQAKYLWISNGQINFCFEIDYLKKSYKKLDDIPQYP